MAKNSAIEWTDHTWNPLTGCTVISKGCTNCYAMKLAGGRLLKDHPSRVGLTDMTKAGPVWNGRIRFNEGWLRQPLQWQKRSMVFVCAHSDLFHGAVGWQYIDQIFAVMALSYMRDDCGHIFQVLTKRPGFARDYINDPETPYRVGRVMKRLKPGLMGENSPPVWPLPNVWLGVSVEDQRAADDRIPVLLRTHAAVRWLSMEPLLGPVKLREPLLTDRGRRAGWIAREDETSEEHPTIDWIVVGGESGKRARWMEPGWANAILEQCWKTETPFHFKQWGNHVWMSERCESLHLTPSEVAEKYRGEATHVGDDVVFRAEKRSLDRLLYGSEYNEWPRGFTGFDA